MQPTVIIHESARFLYILFPTENLADGDLIQFFSQGHLGIYRHQHTDTCYPCHHPNEQVTSCLPWSSMSATGWYGVTSINAKNDTVT